MIFFANDFLLENKNLLLRPSTPADCKGLFSLADPAIWEHSSTSILAKKDMQDYLQRAMDDRTAKIRQQFTIIKKEDRKIIGCSSMENISLRDKRLEIGWTWLGKSFQGQGLNRIAKFLMLRSLFGDLDFERVEFRTRGSNLQSQRALQKIGAEREGTLRSYFIDAGKRHDMVYFSILASEWHDLQTTVFLDLIDPQ